MTHATDGRAARQAPFRPDSVASGAIAGGTVIYTLEGALPVEFLSPGDRIITRNGARHLRHVSVRVDQREGYPPKARLFALHFDEAEVVLGEGVQLSCNPLPVRKMRIH